MTEENKIRHEVDFDHLASFTETKEMQTNSLKNGYLKELQKQLEKEKNSNDKRS